VSDLLGISSFGFFGLFECLDFIGRKQFGLSIDIVLLFEVSEIFIE